MEIQDILTLIQAEMCIRDSYVIGYLLNKCGAAGLRPS